MPSPFRGSGGSTDILLLIKNTSSKLKLDGNRSFTHVQPYFYPHMNPSDAITQTAKFVKHTLSHAEGGHDWHHIYRVWHNAKTIAAEEDVDLVVVELAALLHDIADSKFHDGDETIGPRVARTFLTSIHVEEEIISHVEQIIRHISFKGGHEAAVFHSAELEVVRDADRLDAMGAIGIARAFNYGGFKCRALYDPAIAPNLHMTKEEYKSSTAPTLNHFYEKLLRLEGLMHTRMGKQMARERHIYMASFLDQFLGEWTGER